MKNFWSTVIPLHWDVQRLRWFIRTLEQGWSPEAEDREPEDGEWCVLKLNAVSRGRFDKTAVKVLPTGLAVPHELQIQSGDLLITRANTPAMVGDVCFVSETCSRVILSDLIYRLRLDEKRLDGNYLSYLLLSLPGRQQVESDAKGTSGSMVKISQEHIRNWWIPLPPLSEQRAITRYLAQETEQLDKLIAAKEHVLGLLKEKRRALIAHAVTGGLDSSARLRDSGVSWLGEIPKHWDIWKVGHFAAVGNGSTPNRENAEYWAGGLIPWLNSSVVNQDEVKAADQFITEAAFRECHLPLVKPGSVLIAITGQGKTRGQAAVLTFEATISQHLAFITPEEGLVVPWFLRWILFACYSFLRAISDDAGGTKGALTCEEVSVLKVPLPPVPEQRVIVAHIQEQTTKLDALRMATERTIALLKERRAALIAAAVTGKIDVGGDRADAC